MPTISLVKFNRLYLDLSWNWLNDPEIKQMTNTPDFTRESQQVWFSTLDDKTNYLIWGVSHKDLPIGVCGLKNITNKDCEYWGYIGDKKYWGIGLGSIIMKLLEEKAIELELESIWLRVLNDNVRAIKLYKKNGYRNECGNTDSIIMRKIL
jgi:RimJ/RimL family protein N-acetyltransferase